MIQPVYTAWMPPDAGKSRYRLLLLLLATLVLWGCDPTDRSDPESLPSGFTSGESERHYAIYLEAELSGRVLERRGLTDAGAPRMDTRVEMMLPGSGLLYREERLLFEGEPPHRLYQRTRFTRTPVGIEHHEVKQGEELGAPRLERIAGQLELAAAAPGQTVAQAGLFGTGDNDALLTEWTVTRRDDAGHTFATGTRSDGAQVALELNPDGSPQSYRIGRSFRVERTPEPVLLPVTEQPLLLVPADRSPGDRQRISHMTLELSHLQSSELFAEGPGLRVQQGESGALILQTRRLSAEALSSAERGRLQQLVSRVRAQLRYHAGAAPPSLEALIADGRGDCYEYASLFKALAQAEGLQSRVVTGLAWAGDHKQGFAPHAWNEVRAEGSWVSVDPTWNQVGADASRIRFPDDPAQQLDLQLELRDASIRILEIAQVDSRAADLAPAPLIHVAPHADQAFLGR